MTKCLEMMKHSFYTDDTVVMLKTGTVNLDLVRHPSIICYLIFQMRKRKRDQLALPQQV